MKRRVAILISGRGSNMAALIEAARQKDFPAEIAVVVSNRAGVGGLEKAKASGIPTVVIESKPFGKDRAAFDRAFTAIFDANVTTLISAFILFLLASGPVKGFAVMLCIGLITTIFTAYFCTRVWHDYRVQVSKIRTVSI